MKTTRLFRMDASLVEGSTAKNSADNVCSWLKKSLVFSFLLFLTSGSLWATVFTVTSTADSGPGTLRQAITNANADAAAPHTINFSIPVGSTITLAATALPNITRTMIIDATTTTGWTSNAIGVTLDATSNTGNQVFNVVNVPGFEIYGFQIIGGASTSFGILINGDNADNFKIGAINKRNVINRAGNTVIKVISADNGFIQNNYIGCDVTGTSGYYGTPTLTPPNSGSGLQLTDGANGNTVGGSTTGQGNLIAGGTGIALLLGVTNDASPGLSGCSNNIIYGNRIGGPGTLQFWNCVGIWLDGNSDNNIIGGVLAGQANDLSYCSNGNSCDGNGGSAIRIRSADAQGNTIRGNVMQCAQGSGIKLITAGANNNQPSPTLSAFNTTTNILTGTSTTPNAIIDVYLGSNCNGDYTTNIKSKQYLASTTADASGTWSVNLSSVTCFLNGEYLTATATNPTNGSTGPFASGLLVTLPTPAVYYPPGTYTVGPTGTFCTLKGVANFLNLFTISGAYIFELQPTYNGSTEATPIVFNNNAGSSASNTVTIRPAAGAVNLLIGNGNADNTIRLNGMDFLTIDGRAGGTGTSRNLSIETFNNLGAAIMLRNDAINNSIRFCNVRGGAAYTGAGGSSGGMIGIIEINTLAGSTTGCDNNTIANCLIANNNSSTLSPISGIYCRGLSTTATNNNIVIRNNEFNGIREYGYNGANKYSGIIHFDAFNSAAVIEGNSIYQSTAYNIPLQSSSQIVTQYGIFVHNGSGYSISAANVTNLTGNGNNFIIRDNFIGGSGPNCSGTWTVNAPTSSSGQYRFIGIYVQGHSSIPSGNLATIEGNTIKNIAWGTTAAFSNIAPQLAVWGGIVVVGGQTAATAGHSVIIGSASKPNIIGDNLINGSITVTNAGTVAGNGMNIVGVQVQGMGSGNATIEYNQIGGITASGITGVGRVSTIEGIRVDDGNNIIRYNTIGSTTQANSFNITASATTYSATAANNQIQRVRGIVHSGGTATTASTTIANNTIANLRMNYAATATGPGAARGIVFDNPTPANVRGAIQIQNNTIFNLTSNQNFAASGATANVVGIDFNLSGNTEAANTDISGNTIYGLTTNGSTVITNALGIYYSGRSAGTQTINGNFIRDFASNNINQSQTAIEAAGGVATYSNNIIYLGNAITTHNVLNGISETGGTNQFYFNTSTIGGTATATGANNTFAFTTTVNTGTRNIRNNIFFNARSNSAGTSKHYAISLPGNTGLTINNNNYFVSGTGGVLGRYNAVDNATLGAWQTSTTQDAASQSINPAFTANIANGTGTSTATNYRPTGTGIIAGVAVASVTTDYSGSYRSCNNSLGAFEIAPTAPNLQITNPAAVCSPNTVNLNAVGVITDLNSTSGTTSYFTTLANAISNTSPIAITTAVSASGTYFIRKTAGCGFDVKPVTVTINALPTPTFTVSSSNVCAGSSSVVFTTQSGMTGYTWNITGVGNSIVSGAGTNSVITSWGSNGGNITLNYTNPNGCNAASAISQAVTITPLATPTFTATGTNPVCQGATAQTFTTQTGRSNYLWSVVGGTITAGGGNTNSATITWNTPGAGVVAVNYSNAASPLCFASSYTSANITVNAPPAITAQPTAPTVVCSGAGTQTISVTATGTGLTYSWRKGGIPVVNGAVFSGQGTNTLTLTNPAVADAGSYDVVITGTCTPSVTSSAVTVSVNPLPQGSISGNTVCLGGQSQFTFTATTGTGPYTLIIGGTTYTNVVSGTPFNGPAPSSTTSYTLTSITDANGCVRTSGITGASATLTINTAPAITSQPVAPTVTCSGSGAQTISVTATGAGLTYSWRKGGVAVTNGAVFSGQGTNTLTLTNPLIADAGSYDVVISGTCPASVTSSAVTVGVNPLPQGSISGNTVCSGDQSQFIFTATTGTGPYTLNIGGTFYTNVISGTPFNGPAPSSTTPYTLTSITDANGCVRTTGITGATASITVSQQPTANAGGNVSICQGTSHLVSGASSSNGTILWTHNGAGTLTNATTITPTYNSTVADAGNTVTLTLTVSNAPCSNAVSSLNITVDRLPTISIAGTAPHAITCGTGSVTIGPTEVTIAFASAINWTTSSGGSITAPTTVTPTYAAINANAGNTVVLTGTVTGTGGCSAETASSNYSIAVRPNPIVSVSGGIINGTSVFYNTLAVTNDDGVSVYTWLPATDLYLNPGLTIPYVSGTDASVVYASPFITTTYAVRANRDGCLTQPTNAIVNVSSALTDNICLADAPSGLVAVTNTPSFVLRTLTGSTPSPGSSCGIPISNDVWFRAIVPSTGEVHVMTRQHTNPNPVFNINRSFVQIFSATNCTTGLTMVACNADGAAGSHAYAAATNLAVGSTVYIRLGKVNDPINPGPANQIQLAVTSGLVWTGIADNNFANPANWHGGDATALTVPGASTTAIIPYSTSNIYPVVTGTQSAHGLIFNGAGSLISTLTINTGSELRLVASSLNQSFISRSGSFLPADILGGGTLSFFGGGNNQAAILSSGIRCSGIVGVRTGVTLSTGAANLTIQNNGQLLSGGVELATLGFGGTVSGTIRYIRSGSLYGKYNYWSSPVSGVTTAVLNTNYGHNLYDYDNTRAGAVINVQKGWDYIPSTPEIDRITSPVSMTSGKGFIQTYAGDGTVSFIGAPMETTVNIPVTKTSTNGFNLVGNPYPSSISYNRLKANNASLGTVYLWRSASDGSINPSAYVVIAPTGLVVGNTAGLLPWNAEIGGGQGFLADIASTGTLQFNSSQRVVAGNATQFLDANALTYMRVRLSNISNQAFDAIIGFDQNATDAYDFNYDAPRMPSSDSLELFTYIGEAEYTAKFEAPLVATKIVDLGTSIIGTGTFTLSMPEFLNFDPSVRVFIEDVKAGTFNPFSTSAPYSFTNDPSFDGVRFRLHFMAPVQFASEGACVDQENGKIIVANPNENHPLTAAIHSSIDGIVISDSAPFTGEHIFTNLAGGDYMLQITYPNAEPANMAVEVVSEGEQSAPIVSASATNVSIADAIIEFNASAEGAIAYTWNFGDGTTLTGVSNPVHAYMEPGVYVVTCEAIGQAGCSASATLEISVDANITQVNELLSTEAGMHVFPNPASHQSNIVLNLGESAYSDLVLRITDAAGRVVLMKEIANVKSGAMVSIPTDGFANGIYQIVVEGQKFKQVRKLTIAK